MVKQWGETLVFKVAGKMFLIVSLDGDLAESLSFKAGDEDFKSLTDRDGFAPAPYLARAKWVALEDIGAIKSEELKTLISTSYELVKAKLPKKIRESLR